MNFPEVNPYYVDGKHGSGSGTKTGWKIEVRSTYHEPTILETKPRFVIDHCWREWPIRLGVRAFGVNIPVKDWDRDIVGHGVMPLVVAEAHRWALLAALEASRVSGSLCIETRLVAVDYKYTYELTEKGVGNTQKFVNPHGVELHSRSPMTGDSD